MLHHHYHGGIYTSVWGPDFITILLKEADLNRFSLIRVTLIFTQVPTNVCLNTAECDVEAWTKS